MKKLFCAIGMVVFVAFGIQAQHVEIRGTVKDARRMEAVEFITVALWSADSALIRGVMTDIRGRFSLEKVEPGDYSLAVSGVGFRRQVIALAGLKTSISLPDILLEEEAMELDGILVTASNQVNRVDRKVIFLTEQQMKTSTNGIDLLTQLALPKVSVNPMNMAASLIDGGELQYRINGAKAELQDVLSLQPVDIVRVEYHDNPGLRYGNAAVVLDYIVYRPETGGNGGLLSRAGLKGQLMNNNVYGRVNHKKSEFSITYLTFFRDFNKTWRDNEEMFTLGNGHVLNRREEGEPGRLNYLRHSVNAAYSFQNDKRMLNAALRYYDANDRHNDFTGVLYNMANPADRVKMIDNTSSKAYRPAIDMYYQENLKNSQTLVVNLVGTYNYTDNRRFYDESHDGISLTHVDNGVTGKKYSWIGEGIYEKALGANRISGGLRHSQSYSNNVYRNGTDYTTEMTQGETFLYAEFKGKIRKFDYMLGVGATRSYYAPSNSSKGLEKAGYSNYTFNPRFTLQYSPSRQSMVRLHSEVSNISPSLSELSAIDQTIDSLQIQRGNPLLMPYLRYFSQLTYNHRIGTVNLNMEGSYEYRPNAIMDEKYVEGNKIVQTWNNQQNFQRLYVMVGMRTGLARNILQLSLRGGIQHFISNGNTYNHTYTNWFTVSDISAKYRNVSVGMGIETNRDFFMGETMRGGEFLHFAMTNYTYRNVSLTFMIYNPFVDNYHWENENRSQYASYRRVMYNNDSSRLLGVHFSWNFSFGRKFNATQKKLNNVDEDAGVMSTGK